MVNLCKLYDHLVYFTAIENILWPFGSFCGHLVHFPCFGILYKKSGNPGFRVHSLMRLFLPKQTFSNESRKFSAKKTLKGSFFPYLNKVSFVKFYLPFHLILLHNKKYYIVKLYPILFLSFYIRMNGTSYFVSQPLFTKVT
jgi:hypothetical protein